MIGYFHVMSCYFKQIPYLNMTCEGRIYKVHVLHSWFFTGHRTQPFMGMVKAIKKGEEQGYYMK